MPRERTNAFSLVEVVLALAIASFALLTIMALVPMGLTNNRTSIDESQGVGLLYLLGSDLNSTVNASSTNALPASTTLFNLPLTTAGSSAITTNLYFGADYTPQPTPAQARYQVLVTSYPAAVTNGLGCIGVRVCWPANMAVTNPAIRSVETSLSYVSR